MKSEDQSRESEAEEDGGLQIVNFLRRIWFWTESQRI